MSENDMEQVVQEILDYADEMLLYGLEYKEFYRLESGLEGLIKVNKKRKADINKLINYIAVKENKDYEDIRKEFDIWVI